MGTNNNKIDITDIYEIKDGIITDKSTGTKYNSYKEYIKCLYENKKQAQNTVEFLQSKIEKMSSSENQRKQKDSNLHPVFKNILDSITE